MGRFLALLEASILWAVVSVSIVLWGRQIHWGPLDVIIVLWKGAVVSLCCTIAFYYNDLYDFRVVRNFRDFASRLLQAFGVAFIFLAVFYMVLPRSNIAGGPFASSLIMVLGVLLPLRAISYSIMRWQKLSERVLILGASPLSVALIDEIEAQPHSRLVIVGVVDDPPRPGAPPFRRPLAGSLADLARVIDELEPDRIIVALADRRGRLPITQLLDARIHRIAVVEGVEVFERLTGKLAIETLNPSNLIYSSMFLKSRMELGLGRLVSLAVSLAGLVVSAPLMALITLVIKLDSRGPVLFVQHRVGLYGRRFSLIKFRTMQPEDRPVSEWARDNDGRITRSGKWLRKFRLDELPQFVNILRGDMNLVGPRPHPVSNYELFERNIPYYKLRSGVRPGVTGWAQIRQGYANDLAEETEKMRYDLFYIKHLSLLFDMRILFDTVKTVLFGRLGGAGEGYGGAAAGTAAANGTVVAVNGSNGTSANGAVTATDAAKEPLEAGPAR